MGILLSEADAAVAGGMGLGSVIVMWVLMIGVMYFLMIRPQNKEKKRVAAMLAALEEGDSVLTTSGFYGTVISIEEGDMVIVEFGNNKNCRIPMDKAAISRVEKPGEN